MKMRAIRNIVIVLAVAAICSAAVLGTMAWLVDSSETVVNKFINSDIDVDVDESTGDTYEMIPGWNLSKDPKVTVNADSVDCWVFVKLEKSAKYDEYLIHSVDSAWTQGDGTSIPADVYYRKVTDENGLKGQTLGVLAAGSVEIDSVTYTWGADELLVLPTVTKDMMDSLTEDTYPTLSVSSKVVQLMKNATTEFTAEEAWALTE